MVARKQMGHNMHSHCLWRYLTGLCSKAMTIHNHAIQPSLQLIDNQSISS
jgi:hypothetical protein